MLQIPVDGELPFHRAARVVTLAPLGVRLRRVVRRQMEHEGVEFHLNAGIARVDGARHDIRMFIHDKDGRDTLLQATQ